MKTSVFIRHKASQLWLCGTTGKHRWDTWEGARAFKSQGILANVNTVGWVKPKHTSKFPELAGRTGHCFLNPAPIDLEYVQVDIPEPPA